MVTKDSVTRRIVMFVNPMHMADIETAKTQYKMMAAEVILVHVGSKPSAESTGPNGYQNTAKDRDPVITNL